MIEQNAIACEQPVGLAVIDRNPVSIEFRDGVRRARVERCGLALRSFSQLAEEFRGRSLVKPSFLLKSENANGLEQTQGTERIRVRRVLWFLKRYRHMA